MNKNFTVQSGPFIVNYVTMGEFKCHILYVVNDIIMAVHSKTMLQRVMRIHSWVAKIIMEHTWNRKRKQHSVHQKTVG